MPHYNMNGRIIIIGQTLLICIVTDAIVTCEYNERNITTILSVNQTQRAQAALKRSINVHTVQKMHGI